MEGTVLELPGFRFHPTEEELLDFYLRRVVYGKKLNFDIIGTLNLYRYDPWDLPGKAKMGEREWYFFVPRDRKHASSGRPNRTTERGFWKATGSDRPVRSVSDPKRLIGLKKTLVFYQGRAPRGSKTDWVMNEYRLPDNNTNTITSTSQEKEDIVLCKIYRKATTLKELEQRATMDEDGSGGLQHSASTTDNFSTSSDDNQGRFGKQPAANPLEEEESKEEVTKKDVEITSSSAVAMEPMVKRSLPELELQVPKNGSFEWFQDPFVTQLRSPWMDLWSPYANLLNF